MMHISEGVLSTPVTVCGWTVAGAAACWCARRITEDKMPRTAVLTACFFTASLIHVPLSFASVPTSVHLVLNGLCGIILGGAAFPAILVGLFLQAVLFGHGGLTSLGVNACCIGVPALFVGWTFRFWRDRSWAEKTGGMLVGGFMAGGLPVLLSGLLVMTAVWFSGDRSRTMADLAGWIVVPYIGVAIIEGCVTAWILVFLRKVEPKFLCP